jgi:hypothetical protein
LQPDGYLRAFSTTPPALRLCDWFTFGSIDASLE